MTGETYGLFFGMATAQGMGLYVAYPVALAVAAGSALIGGAIGSRPQTSASLVPLELRGAASAGSLGAVVFAAIVLFSDRLDGSDEFGVFEKLVGIVLAGATVGLLSGCLLGLPAMLVLRSAHVIEPTPGVELPSLWRQGILAGTRHDWVGSDGNGCLAAFTGDAPGVDDDVEDGLPTEIWQVLDDIADAPATTTAAFSSPVSSSGERLCEALATRGLFGYVLDESGTTYVRVAVPGSPMRLTDLPAAAAAVVARYARTDASFAETQRLPREPSAASASEERRRV
jgi:hypothetical protein